MDNQSVRWVAKTDLLLGALALLSCVVLLLPQSWITRNVTLDLASYTRSIYADSVIGGNSQAYAVSGHPYKWQCQLREGSPDPFCSYQISLIGADGKGVDLSKYKTFTIDLGYQNNAGNVRVYLRSRSPEYYVVGDLSTTKYNNVGLNAKLLNKGPYAVGLADFSVADWWVEEKGIPPHYSRPDFHEVLYIEIQTSDHVLPSEYVYTLNSISLSGPIIPQKTMYQGLIALWIGAIVLLLLFRVLQLKLALKRNAKYQRQLMNVNKLLNIQNQQVEDLAKTDPLTGINNRLGIRQAFHDGLANWQSHEQPFSMILLDIDDFKKLNDQHGHDVGDLVLKEVASTLISNVRSSDVTARWGGEEFMIVCPNTELYQARIVAENLCAKIANIGLECIPKITASFGVASMTRDDLDHLFKQADEALYAAKHAGKNRVMLAPTSGLVGVA
ncbi:GGDEF domain-containing protein [Gilvimarinus polysaccharolyticus]|uniref:GGDEF domain-containing protein n=1 Tax=Gilvimarinus polysaccharolyticus TaxID=863921 RepID=UPI0006730CA0|nr:GGDEF domain-containing protein [Gilvimarinus polysaccharolyticus]